MLAVGGILGGLRLTLDHQDPQRSQNYRDLVLAGSALILAGLWPNYWVLLAVSAVFGFCYSSFEIRAITITQNLTAPEFLGRMFGILFLAIDAFQPVGSFIFGFVVFSFTFKNFGLY